MTPMVTDELPPIVGGATAKGRMKNTIGLNQRIKSATSEGVVKALLRDGGLYREASDKTRRKWGRAAKRRLEELEG